MERLSGKGWQRWRLLVTGIVQGVGFRPFVYRLASRWNLTGFVLNDSTGVIVEAEGPEESLRKFVQSLTSENPPLSLIKSVTIETITPVGDQSFVIKDSQKEGPAITLISPDVATCEDCLSEMRDPQCRRYNYPFLNCTNCGPRFTIIISVPYDRARTTMAAFQMCPECEAEYHDPCDRRFHAQPTACPQCGPQAVLLDKSGVPVIGQDPIGQAGQLLKQGFIVAVKGLGGYHIACDAQNQAAVLRLRKSKIRESKPFAVMARDMETVDRFCILSENERECLQSWRRPIVIVKKRPGVPVAPAVAPSHHHLGIFLPYTPLHHLLLDNSPPLLVMTSGNLSDEPIAYKDDDAVKRLAPLVDFFLTHNRPIHMRCDDSVLRFVGDHLLFIRRSRGYAPQPIPLPEPVPIPLLATGGMLKNTFALCRDDLCFVSHHIGDLDHYPTFKSYQEAIDHYKGLFEIEPKAVVYDLHPDYPSTRYAFRLPVRWKIPVQHHHAHIAAVMAEHRLEGPVIGVAFDGTGYGPDGTVWGGEVLFATRTNFHRLAHLEVVPLPGGEKAIRQAWRMAAAWLFKTFGTEGRQKAPWISKAIGSKNWDLIWRVLTSNLPTIPTTSVGRLFDAVSSLLDLCHQSDYEGHSAVALECAAWSCPTDEPGYTFEVIGKEPLVLSPQSAIKQIISDIASGVERERIAFRFHKGLAEGTARLCHLISLKTKVRQVALSGGVMQNTLFLSLLLPALKEKGLEPYLPSALPPNDGGIAFGQAVIGGALLSFKESLHSFRVSVIRAPVGG
ncbi:MAG: carbamoyltransferase HypF [Armatimonadetes bacterium]|nr:carbamoyltransferase HypF [Armatimonadota bacterium]MDW8122398.1 carbamoyltransferase HypF [Armatimonadota bacterium]